jgi:hypothetical protein
MGGYLRRLSIYLLGLLLGLCLILLASSAVFRFVIADANTVKGLLRDSGAYQTFTSSIVDTLAKEQKGPDNSIPVNDPAIKKIINDAFNPEVLQENSEAFIDSLYVWLEDGSQTANIKIDFAKSRQSLINGLSKYGEARLSSLPDCPPNQPQSDIDVFRAKCLPAGANVEDIVSQFKKQLKNDQDFLANTDISSQDIGNDIGLTGVFDESSNVPNIYQKLKLSFLVLIGLITILSASIVWLTPEKRQAAKRLIKVFTGAGVSIIFLAASFKYLIPRTFDNDAFKANQVSDRVIVPLASEFVSAIGNMYLIFGSLALIISGCLGIFYWYKYLKSPGN